MTVTTPVQVLPFPNHRQVQLALCWLASHPQENPDLELALHHLQRGRIVPRRTGEFVAIAHSAPHRYLLTQGHIRGAVMAAPGNCNLSLEGSDRSATEALLNVVRSRGCPRRVFASAQTKEWLRPLMVQHYCLEREFDQIVMACTHAPNNGEGRWALPRDIPALHTYARAYREERGGTPSNPNWLALVRQRGVAVLERDGHVVSVARCSASDRHAFIGGPFTFPPFRRQGCATRLLAFLIGELLGEYPAVKLWVDEDNIGAIALYESLGFQQVGHSYTGYFCSEEGRLSDGI